MRRYIMWLSESLRIFHVKYAYKHYIIYYIRHYLNCFLKLRLLKSH